MAKFELTKSIEAVKLNQRTLRPLNQLKHTISYGAVLEDLTLDRDMQQFHYLRALRVPGGRSQDRPA